MTDPLLPHPDTDQEPARSLPRTTASAARPTVDAAAADGPDPTTLFTRVGGEPFFTSLVDAFYARVAVDEVLRPLYPEQDLGPAAERFRMFLIQYWGGPTTYSQQRGHPRLRMRHAPFPVGTLQIQAWLTAMRGALDQVEPDPAADVELWAYFLKSAPFMRNIDD